jgi:predicted ribosome quality control (RQC) complex YloA/Tae2 family protein
VSNAILYDPLLVRYLAKELDRELRGRACAAAPIFSPGMMATLPLEGGRALRADLHPTRGWIRLVEWPDEEELDAVCLGVESVPDERVLVIRLRTADRFRVGARRLLLELQTNQWNAILVNEEDDRVLTLLRGRTTHERILRPGHPYGPPSPRLRFGTGDVERGAALAHWLGVLRDVPPEARIAELLRGFAYVGTPTAPAILGAAAERAEEELLTEAFDRWWALRSLPDADPMIARVGARDVPVPVRIAGLEGEPIDSLLAAMDRLAAREPPEPAADADRSLLLRRIDGRVAAASRRGASLEDELSRTGEVDRLRSYGDLLLANKRLVPRGADRVRLMGWDRKIVEIELDPASDAAENAARWYAEARRRARAEERLPALLESAREEERRWSEARAAVERGEIPGWVERELERAGNLGVPRGSGDQEQSRPYRVYRTAGGLEVRVGRNSRDNDRLTFGNSSPNDVWLHARSVAGSHVILRWSDPEGSPPARDLEEAATLAALFSKARTSALVPVDWTRRKHVRKPRGAPAGAVIPQRVKTLFVTPDPEVEERLRE